MHQSAARISEKDIAELDTASNRLATAAQAIRRANPVWCEPVVQLLIEANNTVVRLRDKGAASFARYLERHGTRKPQDASDAPAAADNTVQAPIASPGEEEA